MFEWEFLSWAFTVAAFVYGGTALCGKHLPQGFQETVALWLHEKEEQNWAAAFTRLFDRLFGERHLSIRRALSSAIASVVALLVLYTLFGPILGLFARVDQQMPLGELLLLGLLVNVAADYVSLWETRWLLSRFEKVRGIGAQLSLLLIDLIFTALIIYTTITLYRLVTGQDLLLPIELLVAYTPYAIFFYSTFLTSIWAWAFCASAWFIRLFNRLGLDKAPDVWDRPFTQIGFVAAALVMATLILSKPAMEYVLPKDFDGALCDMFGGPVCTHASRLSDDDTERLARIQRACTTGDPTQCRSIIDELPEKLSTEAVVYYEAACLENADFAACNTLGFFHYQGLGVPADEDIAVLLFIKACNGGDIHACENFEAVGDPLKQPQEFGR